MTDESEDLASLLQMLLEQNKRAAKSQETTMKLLLALYEDYAENLETSSGLSRNEIDKRVIERMEKIDFRKSKMFVVR